MAEVARPVLPQGNILPGARIPGGDGMPPPPSSLYVGDLTPDVTETMLLEKFAPIGTVASIRVCRDSITRRSLNYAYVNYQNYADAERALSTLNYEPLNGKPIRIMFSNRDPSARRNGVGNIFIKKLHASVDSKALHDTFSQFGKILSCKVSTNEQGQSNGFGFVNFADEESAEHAIQKVDGMIICDQKVSVAKFVPKKERSSGPNQNTFTNVYANGFPAEYSEDQVKALFAKFGKITSLFYSKSKQNLPFACVNYETNAEASEAIKQLNETDLDGSKLFVARAQKKTERQTQLRRQFEQHRRELETKHLNLYIKNLDDDVDDAKLKEAFAPFGNVVSAKVMRDNTNTSKGFGFVSFEKAEEVTKALTEMNGRIISTKPLYVALAQRKAERLATIAAQRHRAAMNPMGPYGFFPPGMPGQMPFPRFRGGQYMLPPNQMGAFPPQFPPRPQNRRGPNPQQPGLPGGPLPPRPTGAPAQPNMYPGSQEPLTASALAAASDPQRKQVLGERLFPKIRAFHPQDAAKITGMLLEMDNSELLHLLEDEAALREKTTEAFTVLREHEKKQGRPTGTA